MVGGVVLGRRGGLRDTSVCFYLSFLSCACLSQSSALLFLIFLPFLCRRIFVLFSKNYYQLSKAAPVY